MGVLYHHQGRYREAESYYKEALAILIEQLESHPDVATCLSNLAELYKSQGLYQEATALYVKALDIRYESLGKDHFQVATSYHSLAGILHVQGRYSDAEALYDISLEIRREEFGNEHLSVAFSLNGIGRLYQDQGLYSDAEPLLRDALEIFRQQLGERHPFVASSFNNLVALYQAEGSIAELTSRLNASLDIEEWNLELNLPTLADTQRQAYAAQLSNTTNRAISLHLQAAPDSEEASQLALTTLLRRKGRILDAGTDSLKALRQNLTPEDQATLDQLTEVYRELSALAFRLPADLSIEQYQAELARLEADAIQLEATLARNSTSFRTATEPVEIASIQRQIPANGVLVEYIRYRPFDAKNVVTRFGPPRYAAYLLFPDGRREAVDLGTVAEIDAAVQAFSHLLQGPETDSLALDTIETAIANMGATIEIESDAEGIAGNIRSLIFDPIAAYVIDREHLLISPDGQLNRLPFEALITDHNRYLIEQYQISYLNSGRDLLRLDITMPSDTPALILANPDYDKATPALSMSSDGEIAGEGAPVYRTNELVDSFIPLPGTAAEAAAIAPLLPNAIVLTEEQATENALKAAEAPQILHIATHGFFLTDVERPTSDTRSSGIFATGGARFSFNPEGLELGNPLLRSGLALAGSNVRQSSTEDGVLTALEASTLNLFGTQLVVLSACETGLGEIANGEGVYGLRRAFALAGAEAQLMSLWLVDDFGTQSLMARYYEKLTAGMGRSEALRETQLEMIKEGGEYSHPYYWAAFILAGDWRPLE